MEVGFLLGVKIASSAQLSCSLVTSVVAITAQLRVPRGRPGGPTRTCRVCRHLDPVARLRPDLHLRAVNPTSAPEHSPNPATNPLGLQQCGLSRRRTRRNFVSTLPRAPSTNSGPGATDYRARWSPSAQMFSGHREGRKKRAGICRRSVSYHGSYDLVRRHHKHRRPTSPHASLKRHARKYIGRPSETKVTLWIFDWMARQHS